MRFLIDAQLPPMLARHLIGLGHHAEHVADVGLQAAGDFQIWTYAVANTAILVTKDEDFVVIRALEAVGTPVVWVRIGNTTRRALLERFSVAWPAIVAALERGETVIEVT
jgi:predicted nuclease of predicted toxin-antitoxin system